MRRLSTPIRKLAARTDWRLVKLERFFEACQCPVKRVASHFLTVSDRHRIDWRLLPSLSFVESTGGKVARGNNVFGWANGSQGFRTIEESIDLVGERLANSSHYRGKSVDQILTTYNPVNGYALRVKTVMARISAI